MLVILISGCWVSFSGFSTAYNDVFGLLEEQRGKSNRLVPPRWSAKLGSTSVMELSYRRLLFMRYICLVERAIMPHFYLNLLIGGKVRFLGCLASWLTHPDCVHYDINHSCHYFPWFPLGFGNIWPPRCTQPLQTSTLFSVKCKHMPIFPTTVRQSPIWIHTYILQDMEKRRLPQLSGMLS